MWGRKEGDWRAFSSKDETHEQQMCTTLSCNPSFAFRCVLAGDHLQLPPTITSQAAADQGLSKTLLERAIEKCGQGIVSFLAIQYRMHEKIMRWSSDHFYDSRLVADDSVRQHTLLGLHGVEETEDSSAPLIMIDTAGCGLEEMVGEDELSKANEVSEWS